MNQAKKIRDDKSLDPLGVKTPNPKATKKNVFLLDWEMRHEVREIFKRSI